MTNEELLIIKGELSTDPLSLGLTTASEDDEVNANLLNEIRKSIRVYRSSAPANDIVIPVDELGALNESQRSSWQIEVQDGSVNPSAYEANFFSMFAENTESRAIWESATKESASRARQLLNRYVNLTPSDISQARVAT